MGILAWIFFGLIAGILAKWIMPGRDGGGFIMTVVLGIAGSVVGGFISTKLGIGSVSGFNLPSMGISIVGALVLLFVYRQFAGGKS
ncbi:Uncharacterized membrane protein YeaQ/YmgE, transglycosylase-associated protein family [Aeromonas sp. RU39B]|jgi:uncharacterized membrane protein YeaQ/YmgE (transglycosylase-associated protein family)|uniref:GlsB/YeaQ/YmgE family stress response membrane protein n=1 Tax=Aeromonas sp. RU39B TaxID=1907416 RepID=UPI00095468EA|nr:GlsB/YeaQ/YmgE family stress response membrane protein [Aeromonas sp. RU39B]SIQ42588.1 Uncharacterized membrane protein YeaQ/YmgE, transglycosylase-associated protein family [Aeromonas sp. RU39B]